MTSWIRNAVVQLIDWTCNRYCPRGQMCYMYEMPYCRRYRLLVWLLGEDLDGIKEAEG